MSNKITTIPHRTQNIRLGLIDRDPGQPRQTFNQKAIEELAENIAENGLIHPIYLRLHPEKQGRFILVAGERRFRALKSLGVEEFEFRVVEKGLPPYILSIIENSHRVDLNPIEQAESYRECMKRDGMTIRKLSEYTGRHTSEIYRVMRYLKLAPEVQKLVREGKLIRTNVQNLAQFGSFQTQIRIAKQLLAGEDPPEFDEALVMGSDRSDSTIASRLPETAYGLIRRMLEFRRRAHAAGFAIDAYLNLPQPKQLEGWRKFTSGVRDVFMADLIETIKILRDLEKHLDSLPETKFSRKSPESADLPPGARRAGGGK